MATGAGSLAGRVALVTGASSGIGAAVARSLAEAGAGVALVARRVERLSEVAAGIEAAGGRALAVPADVSDRVRMEEAVARAARDLGPVDILVSNAGLMPLSPVAELQVDEWDRMIDVNLKGVLYGVAAVLPGMLARRRGHVVTVGSVAGRRPFPGGTVYSATKFAVRALNWGMQLELSAAAGIRFTDVQPGVVETELLEQVSSPQRREAFEAAWEGKRKLLAEDVARAVLFAVSAPDHVNVNEILVRPTDQAT